MLSSIPPTSAKHGGTHEYDNPDLLNNFAAFRVGAHLAPPLNPLQIEGLPLLYRRIVGADGYIDKVLLRKRIPNGVPCIFSCGQVFKSYAQASIHLVSKEFLNSSTLDRLGFKPGEVVLEDGTNGQITGGWCKGFSSPYTLASCPFKAFIGDHINCGLVLKTSGQEQQTANAKRPVTSTIQESAHFSCGITKHSVYHQSNHDESATKPQGLPCQCGLLWPSPEFVAAHCFTNAGGKRCRGRPLTVEEFICETRPALEVGEVRAMALRSNALSLVAPDTLSENHDSTAADYSCTGREGENVYYGVLHEDTYSSTNKTLQTSHSTLESLVNAVPDTGMLVIFPYQHTPGRSTAAGIEAKHKAQWLSLVEHHYRVFRLNAYKVELQFYCPNQVFPLIAGSREYALAREAQSTGLNRGPEDEEQQHITASALLTDAITSLFETRPPHTRILLMIAGLWTVSVPLIVAMCATIDFHLHVGISLAQVQIADKQDKTQNATGPSQVQDNSSTSRSFEAILVSNDPRCFGFHYGRYWFRLEASVIARVFAGLQKDMLTECYLSWCDFNQRLEIEPTMGQIDQVDRHDRLQLGVNNAWEGLAERLWKHMETTADGGRARSNQQANNQHTDFQGTGPEPGAEVRLQAQLLQDDLSSPLVGHNFWTEAEVALAIQMHTKGENQSEIARVLGRKPAAVSIKFKALGVKDLDYRWSRDQFHRAVQMHKEGYTHNEISEATGKSIFAVGHMLKKEEPRHASSPTSPPGFWQHAFQLHQDGFTIQRISQKIDKSAAEVVERLSAMGVIFSSRPIRQNRLWTDETYQMAQDLVLKGATTKEIAEILGTTDVAVRKQFSGKGWSLKNRPPPVRCLTCHNDITTCIRQDNDGPCDHCINLEKVTCTFRSKDGVTYTSYLTNNAGKGKKTQISLYSKDDNRCTLCRENGKECIRPNPGGPCLYCITHPKSSRHRCVLHPAQDKRVYFDTRYFISQDLDDGKCEVIRDLTVPDNTYSQAEKYRHQQGLQQPNLIQTLSSNEKRKTGGQESPDNLPEDTEMQRPNFQSVIPGTTYEGVTEKGEKIQDPESDISTESGISTEYRVRNIIGESDTHYYIDWEDDEVTGEKYDPTWEIKEFANRLAVTDWEAQKQKQRAL